MACNREGCLDRVSTARQVYASTEDYGHLRTLQMAPSDLGDVPTPQQLVAWRLIHLQGLSAKKAHAVMLQSKAATVCEWTVWNWAGLVRDWILERGRYER